MWPDQRSKVPCVESNQLPDHSDKHFGVRRTRVLPGRFLLRDCGGLYVLKTSRFHTSCTKFTNQICLERDLTKYKHDAGARAYVTVQTDACPIRPPAE